MRETDIEIEEKEVERIYCDECGSECTDDHEVEPKDVCPSCAEGRTTYNTFREALNDVTRMDTAPDSDMGLGFDLFLMAIWPFSWLILWVSYFDRNEEPTYHDWRTFNLFTVATFLWTAIPLLLLLII